MNETMMSLEFIFIDPKGYMQSLSKSKIQMKMKRCPIVVWNAVLVLKHCIKRNPIKMKQCMAFLKKKKKR